MPAAKKKVRATGPATVSQSGSALTLNGGNQKTWWYVSNDGNGNVSVDPAPVPYGGTPQQFSGIDTINFNPSDGDDWRPRDTADLQGKMTYNLNWGDSCIESSGYGAPAPGATLAINDVGGSNCNIRHMIYGNKGGNVVVTGTLTDAPNVKTDERQVYFGGPMNGTTTVKIDNASTQPDPQRHIDLDIQFAGGGNGTVNMEYDSAAQGGDAVGYNFYDYATNWPQYFAPFKGKVTLTVKGNASVSGNNGIGNLATVP